MFNIYNIGIYTDYSKIRGIRMLKKVHYNDIYSYNTRENKNLTKEDILKAKDFYDASKEPLNIEIYVEVSTTYDFGVPPSFMWIPIESFNVIV